MLICPCHQSTFDVLTGAIPIFGPAAGRCRSCRSRPAGRDVRRHRRLPRAGRPELLGHHVDDRARHDGPQGARADRGTGPDRARPPRRLARRADRLRRPSRAASSARSSRTTGRSCSARSPSSASCPRRDRHLPDVLLRGRHPRPATYDGPYAPLQGAEVSAAFDSVMRLTFEVRAGLLMRQIHHWAALVFVAAIVVHLRASSSPARSAGRARSTGSSGSSCCCSPS